VWKLFRSPAIEITPANLATLSKFMHKKRVKSVYWAWEGERKRTQEETDKAAMIAEEEAVKEAETRKLTWQLAEKRFLLLLERIKYYRDLAKK
jgi:hypothetical protein